MGMKTLGFVALLFILQVPALGQDSRSLLGNSYVQRAAEAMGGVNHLKAIKTMRSEYRRHSYVLDESERPDGPWIVTYDGGVEIRDYEHQRLRRDSDQVWLGAAEGDKSSLTVADGIAQVTRGDKRSPASPYVTEPEDSLEALAFAPERVVLHALGAEDTLAEPDASFHSEPYHVVSFTYNHVPARLYFNAFTGLPGLVEWTNSYPDSVFWRVWGDVHNRCEFSVYSMLPGGLRLPLQYDHTRNGQPYRVVSLLKIVENPQIPVGTFSIAPEVESAFRQRRAAVSGASLGKGGSLIAGDDSMVQFIGPFNTALIKQSDGLVVLEAPVSSEHTRALFAEAATRYPGVPIKAVITTSDAWAHFGGLREAVAQGIPIYATDLNQPVLTRFVEAPFTQHPDTLFKAPKTPKFAWVSAKKSIGTGPNRLELYPIRNASGERMMMVYFPEHKLLYSSDLVQPQPGGTFFWPEYLRELKDAVDREHLDVDRFFGMHARITPWSDVLRFLASLESGST
jgi:hypothetical protein